MTGCNFSSLPSSCAARSPGNTITTCGTSASQVAGCGFLGVAVSGTPDRPTRDSWYNASASCVVLVQEPGHNFGMLHASSMRCGTGATARSFVDQPMGTCTHSEYGDPYDPMGRACRHMNAYMKAFQGWFGGCNMVDVTSSGTFTINPLELPCDGVQVLQIPMPKMRPFTRSGGGGPSGITTLTHYYVEFRASHGFDRMHRPDRAGARLGRRAHADPARVPHLGPGHEPGHHQRRWPGRRRQLHRPGGQHQDHGRIDGRPEGLDQGGDHRRRGRRSDVPGRDAVHGPRSGTRKLRRRAGRALGRAAEHLGRRAAPIGGGSDASNNAPSDGGGTEIAGGDMRGGTGGAGGRAAAAASTIRARRAAPAAPAPAGRRSASATGGTGAAGRGGSGGQAGSGMNATGGSTAAAAGGLGLWLPGRRRRSARRHPRGAGLRPGGPGGLVRRRRSASPRDPTASTPASVPRGR